MEIPGFQLFSVIYVERKDRAPVFGSKEKVEVGYWKGLGAVNGTGCSTRQRADKEDGLWNGN